MQPTNPLRLAPMMLAIALLIASCNQKELKQEAEKLRATNEHIFQDLNAKDSLVAYYMGAFQEISSNLNTIREKEGSVKLETEMGKSVSESVKADILMIDSLMQANRDKLAELDKKMKGMQFANNKLQKTMETLKASYEQQLVERDEEIFSLKEAIAVYSDSIRVMTATLAAVELVNQEKDLAMLEKDQEIAQKTTELNTGWFAQASLKKLKDENLVVSEGGFLGLGRTVKFNGKTQHNLYNRLDITETMAIPIEGKKPWLVTDHPDGSYKFDDTEEGKQLVITDPEKFWQTSRYLVVAVN
jgi:hypothetical protein